MPVEHPTADTAPVAVVIPHLNRLDDTATCCRSLAAQTRPPRRIIVVDNASTAHGAADLAAACPMARVLRLETNRGFAGGVNAGLREALSEPEMEYFWILNNDTVCPPETLARLLAAAEADRRIGLIGTPLLEGATESNRRRIPAGRRLAGPWAVPRPAHADRAPDYLTGASLLIRREVLAEIGLFDEGFFFFFEDADYSRRAFQHGWRLAVATEAVIEHCGSATIRRLGEMQARCYRAGHVRYLRKHARQPLAAAILPFLFRLAADALRLRIPAVRGNLRGWREGWRQPLV